MKKGPTDAPFEFSAFLVFEFVSDFVLRILALYLGCGPARAEWVRAFEVKYSALKIAMREPAPFVDSDPFMIGVGKADWFRPPLPPNRTGGFPASGFPVSGPSSWIGIHANGPFSAR
ncbi:MAG TPA: hypothetical protein VFC78_23120, partial [Tepidisphaeraceae bacterium]|nr:hypothetical protein [Tepidisphaeraceae bacterium]